MGQKVPVGCLGSYIWGQHCISLKHLRSEGAPVLRPVSCGGPLGVSPRPPACLSFLGCARATANQERRALHEQLWADGRSHRLRLGSRLSVPRREVTRKVQARRWSLQKLGGLWVPSPEAKREKTPVLAGGGGGWAVSQFAPEGGQVQGGGG